MGDTLIKERKLKIDRKRNQINGNVIMDSLKEKEGILTVNNENQGDVIRIEYDLKKINFDTIEALLNQLGIILSTKWSERLKRGMAKFTEQNELDNLTATPTSCCEDPKKAIRNRKSCHS